jgi:hypothetical protein
MTSRGKDHVEEIPSIFILGGRAQLMAHFVVYKINCAWHMIHKKA